MEGRVITLTTDFGLDDPFVGIMKGVILRINPSAIIVDITHGIRPYDIKEAALALDEAVKYFPENTIHVVVVDPGVGSERRPILAIKNGRHFVGPDNGVFTTIYSLPGERPEVIHMTAEKYFLPKAGSTFHGRDVFAPAAAWLSKGVPPGEFGDTITDYVRINIPMPVKNPDGVIEGEVIHIDRFGNAITNISRDAMADMPGPSGTSVSLVMIKGITAGFRSFYAEGHEDELSCLVNSSGRLEIFFPRGSAAQKAGIAVGDRVVVKPPVS